MFLGIVWYSVSIARAITGGCASTPPPDVASTSDHPASFLAYCLPSTGASGIPQQSFFTSIIISQ